MTAADAPADIARQTAADAATASQTAQASAAKLDNLVNHYAPADCNTPLSGKDVMSCQALVATTTDQRMMVNAAGPPSTALTPADIQSAYHLPAGGAGQTVAIVDAYGYAAAEADLGVFRRQFGLPDCTTNNGCFHKVDQRGGDNYPSDNAGWSLETALDLDAVSSACPACHILLVQADNATAGSLGAGVDTAVALGAKFVSNSYGHPDSDASGLNGADYQHPGVVITASAGDTGNVTLWPSSDPDVVAAGGTLLTRAAGTARGWTESAWSNGGSGCSTFEPQPDYQAGLTTSCANKATADIAADADPHSGLAIYNSLNSGWEQVGGTSLSSPLIASMYALAGTPAAGTYPVTYPYAHRNSGLFDIVQGSDGSCGNLLCQAGPGWDGPTGLGTPDGVTALAPTALATVNGRVTDQATGAPLAGATVTLTDETDKFQYHVKTDSSGAYRAAVSADTYDVSASFFGYGTSTRGGVTAAASQTATADLALAMTPHHTVTGKVTDGSGHGWPLYAKITIDGDPNGPVYTDPKTGAYAVNLPDHADYAMHVAPVYPGYNPVSFTLPLDESDVEHDVSVTADTQQCATPGYAYPAQADFEGWNTGPKYGWTVSHRDGFSQGWQFDNPGNLGNFVGAGGFATADPWQNGGVAEDTDLTSPAFDLTGVTSANLQFDTLVLLSPGAAVNASVTTDNGAIWTPVYQRDNNDAVVEHVDVPLTAALGHNNVQVRFHYNGQGNSLFQLDNVQVGQCQVLGGGLIQGNVHDANTGQPVNGATITDKSADVSDMFATAVSTATPDNPKVGDGFYWLYSPKAGGNTVATTAPRYATTQATVAVSDGVNTHQPALQAGRLQVTPGAVSLRTALPGQDSQDITLTNTGGAPLRVTVAEQSATTAATAAGANPAAGSWQKLPNYPEPVMMNVIGSYEGKTYSVGGIDHTSGGNPLKSGYAYDPGAGTWSPIADLPQPRVGATGAFVNGTLYVAGGAYVPSPGQSGVLTSTTYAYHPHSDSWSQVADLPEPLQNASAAVFDGKLYVVGGFKADTSVSAAVYRYDPAANAWTRIADYPTSVESNGCGGIVGGIVCAGGDTEPDGHVHILNTAYVYHPQTNAWARVADMPYAVFNASYSSANGELQVVGGVQYTSAGSPATGTDHAVQYDPVADVWTALPNAPQSVFAGGKGTGCGFAQIGGTQNDEFTWDEHGGVNAAILPGFDQCGDDDVNWLSEDRTTVNLAPGESTQVQVTADARVLAAPGDYAAKLSMITDSPYLYQPVPVVLKVTAPGSWAEVSGTVTDAATGKPLAGATVAVSEQGEQLITDSTDSRGRYDVWRKADSLTLTVSADGYGSRSQEVTLEHRSLTTADFALPSS
jgi:N-acetylneuraminic acid mutarotase